MLTVTFRGKDHEISDPELEQIFLAAHTSIQFYRDTLRRIAFSTRNLQDAKNEARKALE